MYFISRFFDIIGALIGLLLLAPVILIVLAVGWIDIGSPLFFQKRVGHLQQIFVLIKFRTMRKGTPSVASHLVESDQITPLGSFLRRTKIDEIPQLWNVLVGQMSFVGPRPCLPNQEELIRERIARNIFQVKPGITGLAQIRNIDMSVPILLAETEAEMLDTLTLRGYFVYIFITIAGGGRGDTIK